MLPSIHLCIRFPPAEEELRFQVLSIVCGDNVGRSPRVSPEAEEGLDKMRLSWPSIETSQAVIESTGSALYRCSSVQMLGELC